jgi:hypothetical protein
MSFSSAIKPVSPDARAGCLGHSDEPYRPGSGYPDAATQRSFSLYSAAHPKHGMSAFAPLLGHSERRATDQSTDLVLDMPMSASLGAPM